MCISYWMCGTTGKDKVMNADIHVKVDAVLIIKKMESHLRWFEHIYHMLINLLVKKVESINIGIKGIKIDQRRHRWK